MTVRDIQNHQEEMYGAKEFPTLISSMTDAVMEDANAGQARPLDTLCPIAYPDGIDVKTHDAGTVRAKVGYLTPGIGMTGKKELPGLWIAQTEGAKFWLHVVTEPKNLGVQTSSWPVSMASRDSPPPLRRCTPRRQCSFAS